MEPKLETSQDIQLETQQETKPEGGLEAKLEKDLETKLDRNLDRKSDASPEKLEEGLEKLGEKPEGDSTNPAGKLGGYGKARASQPASRAVSPSPRGRTGTDNIPKIDNVITSVSGNPGQALDSSPSN